MSTYPYITGDGHTVLSSSTPIGATDPVSDLDDSDRQIISFIKDLTAGTASILSTKEGMLKLKFGDTASRPTTGLGDFVLFYDTDTNQLLRYDLGGAQWEVLFQNFIAGTTGQLLVSQGAGAPAVFSNPDELIGTDDIVLVEQQLNGVDSASYASSVWNARELNLEVENNITGAVFNDVTFKVNIPAGTYRIEDGWATGVFCRRCQARLQDTTNNITLATGSTERSEPPSTTGGRNNVKSILTQGEKFSVGSNVDIQLQFQNESVNIITAANFGIIERYASLRIAKIS